MRKWIALVALAMGLAGGFDGAAAQTATVPVMMLSDIHFDPFHDPGKVTKLVAAPAAEWEAILAAPATATAAEDFAGLQQTCHATKGVDTSWALLESSLKAEAAQMAKPLFVTVSGDLMAHQFDCRYKTLVPTGTATTYSEFAAKTVEFVTLELRKTFAGVPIYLALGNNDSGCKDYAEDANSAFLQADGRAFSEAVDKRNADAVIKDFSQYGDYSVKLPKPMEKSRLIVLQDIFESRRYTTCGGDAGAAAETAQISWLRAELQAARRAHEQVWVMAHIPPGVDAFATLSKGKSLCGPGGNVASFLSSDALADAITEYRDVVRLALFGHTHMDEIKLLQTGGVGAASFGGVAAKLVPSISPVDGNNPSFTTAEVEPATAVLKDYAVYAASNQTGVGAKWSLEYRYSTTYGMPDFSAASVNKLTQEFLRDKAGTSDVSQAYQKYFFVGDPASLGVSAAMKAAAMQIVWPAYACSIREMHASDFKSCACAAKK